MEELYIAALDIGTTSIRCHIVNRQCVTVGIASNKVSLSKFIFGIILSEDNN